MFDGIDDIDWVRLGHAYGSAGDVPGLLRALRSPDEQERHAAFGALYASIFHQGTRYEASAYAVPFLLELLADPAAPDRELVLYLVTVLAVGHDARWLPQGIPVVELRRVADGGRELLAAKPPPWHGDDEARKEYVEYAYVESLDEADRQRLWAYVELAVYDAVRAGVPLLRDLLTDAAPGLRVGAAYALAWFPQDAAGSIPALVAAAEAAVEVDEGEAATALVAAGLLGAAPDAGLLADPRPVIRWAAAVGRARVLGVNADEATVDELLAWTAAAEPDNRPATGGAEVPFLDGDLNGYAGLSLRLLGPRHTDRALDALLDRLSVAVGEQALPVVAEALRLAFPGGRLPAGVDGAALAARQRRLVEVLARSPGAWLIDGVSFGNFASLVGDYGLPRSREAMLAYLDGPPAGR
ncbi:hypothetical protein [Micromonospora antibiotica]|uniref:HEAT repeat domain-containing protein n=1 Tax=Micromonospora antibiotica TaxID=2807623 RepID=A0ABS3VGE7_9ACTN|nr:hypothetical protein [Micromonospora antibiotica]MBO4164701.1 hypothetical protein [Micromonospora antibiotica]